MEYIADERREYALSPLGGSDTAAPSAQLADFKARSRALIAPSPPAAPAAAPGQKPAVAAPVGKPAASLDSPLSQPLPVFSLGPAVSEEDAKPPQFSLDLDLEESPPLLESAALKAKPLFTLDNADSPLVAGGGGDEELLADIALSPQLELDEAVGPRLVQKTLNFSALDD